MCAHGGARDGPGVIYVRGLPAGPLRSTSRPVPAAPHLASTGIALRSGWRAQLPSPRGGGVPPGPRVCSPSHIAGGVWLPAPWTNAMASAASALDFARSGRWGGRPPRPRPTGAPARSRLPLAALTPGEATFSGQGAVRGRARLLPPPGGPGTAWRGNIRLGPPSRRVGRRSGPREPTVRRRPPGLTVTPAVGGGEWGPQARSAATGAMRSGVVFRQRRSSGRLALPGGPGAAAPAASAIPRQPAFPRLGEATSRLPAGRGGRGSAFAPGAVRPEPRDRVPCPLRGGGCMESGCCE